MSDLSQVIGQCSTCNNIRLAGDLSVVHLQRRFDPHPSAVRVHASLPEHHPIFVGDSSLDAVKRLLAEDRSQMLGNLRFSAKLEGLDRFRTLIRTLPALELLRFAPMDEAARLSSLSPDTLEREHPDLRSVSALAWEHYGSFPGCVFLLSRRSQTKGRRYTAVNPGGSSR